MAEHTGVTSLDRFLFDNVGVFYSRTLISLSLRVSAFLNLPSILASDVSGLGCLASSSSLADRRSARAVSAGPKTEAARRWLFALRVLERLLLAMIVDFELIDVYGEMQPGAIRMASSVWQKKNPDSNFYRGAAAAIRKEVWRQRHSVTKTGLWQCG